LYADYQLPEAAGALQTTRVVAGAAAAVAYCGGCFAAAAAVFLNRHERAVYEITGAESFSADDLAALYAKLCGRPVRARALDDDAFISTLVGAAANDDHLRYGAELVASFGRSIREGYMDSRTDAVAKLTGRAPQPLAEILAPLRG
jgi:NAD(P)H dehydrogenase (quinone)